jgi:hypothetical protein
MAGEWELRGWHEDCDLGGWQVIDEDRLAETQFRGDGEAAVLAYRCAIEKDAELVSAGVARADEHAHDVKLGHAVGSWALVSSFGAMRHGHASPTHAPSIASDAGS